MGHIVRMCGYEEVLNLINNVDISNSSIKSYPLDLFGFWKSRRAAWSELWKRIYKLCATIELVFIVRIQG